MVILIYGLFKRAKWLIEGEKPQKPLVPEDKDEEHEQHAEGGYVVHCLHQDHQLAAEGRHETHQFQHPEQPKSSQHGQASIWLADDLPDAAGCKKEKSY